VTISSSDEQWVGDETDYYTNHEESWRLDDEDLEDDVEPFDAEDDGTPGSWT
jgi:hypothetical protein